MVLIFAVILLAFLLALLFILSWLIVYIVISPVVRAWESVFGYDYGGTSKVGSRAVCRVNLDRRDVQNVAAIHGRQRIELHSVMILHPRSLDGLKLVTECGDSWVVEQFSIWGDRVLAYSIRNFKGRWIELNTDKDLQVVGTSGYSYAKNSPPPRRPAPPIMSSDRRGRAVSILSSGASGPIDRLKIYDDGLTFGRHGV
jgi:hypothetical protein